MTAAEHDVDLIIAALEFAARAHSRQTRKGSETPYIVHPVGVMLLLLQAGENDPELLAAALLHDTVEDAGVSLEELQRRFGARVAAIVAGCSEPDKSASWEARKQHTIEHLRCAPREVLLVAAADKLHNLHSLRNDYVVEGERVWTHFRRGRDAAAWYYRSVAASLQSGGLGEHPLFQRLRVAIDNFFGPVIA